MDRDTISQQCNRLQKPVTLFVFYVIMLKIKPAYALDQRIDLDLIILFVLDYMITHHVGRWFEKREGKVYE